MPLTFTENRQRNVGLSVSTNPRTVLRSTGLAEATNAEALAGTIQHRYMSPLRVAQVIANEATGDLTRVSDTNVTLTLGGTPTDALWNDVSITVGWSGTLAASRGGFGADVSASSGVPLFATGTATFTSTTGTGDFVRATAPTVVGGSFTAITPFSVRSSGSAFDLRLTSSQVFTSNRMLTINPGDADRILNMGGGNITVDTGAFTATGAAITLTATGATNVTLPTTGTLAAVESGAWTPTLSFATPGDSSIVLSTAVGRYQKVGSVVRLWYQVTTSTFTHTTASGNLQIGGFSFTAATVAGINWRGLVRWQGITKANYTQVNSTIASGGTVITFGASGSGQGAASITASDTPTGGSVNLSGWIEFEV